MPGADGLGIALGQFDHGGIGAGPAHHAFARGFAKSHAEADAWHCVDQRFVNVLDGFDEVGLAQNEIRVLRLVDFLRDELHLEHLLSRRCCQGLATVQVSRFILGDSRPGRRLSDRRTSGGGNRVR
ncbi:hypothetical protein D3C84_937950 [compost metagenome]